MDERIAASLASGLLKPRAGHNSTVTIRHVDPQPRVTTTTKKRSRQSAPPEYPGFQPKEKDCRREGCPNTFMPTAPAAAYCSPECRAEAIRAQRRETDRAKREREREHEQQLRGGKPYTLTCRLEGCDREFEPEHPNSRYCSPEHRAEATRIIKARTRAKREGKPAPAMPTSATRQAMAHIEQADRATGGQPVGLEAQEYITHLWRRVQEDPDCPAHVFDRLERLLGLTPSGSTIER